MRIELKEVSVRYGKVNALENASLTIDAGQIVAVLGANGAGKTTLLRCLGGIVVPTSGEILFDNEPFSRGKTYLRKRLGFLPDFPLVFQKHTPLKHIGMVLKLYDADKPGIESRVMELLRGFDLMPLVEKPIGQLSRGQYYKTTLAAILAVDPELLLFDEPFASGMDPKGIAFFKHQVQQAAARGRVIIYSTQILDLAEKVSSKVCLIDHGQIRHFAPVEEHRGTHAAEGGLLEQLFEQLSEGTQ